MKKFLFLLLSAAVAVSASAGIEKNQLQGKITGGKLPKAKTEYVNAFKTRAVEKNQMFKAPVTTEPAGEVRTYVRSGECLAVEGEYVEHLTQDGLITLIFAEDNVVWFKNIFYLVDENFGNSYVYGNLSADGTKITVPMGQSIYYSSYYDADVVLSYGTSSVGSNIVWTPDASVTEVVYAIEGNKITLQGCGGAAPSGSEYPEYEYNGLGSVWTDDGTFGGYLEWETVFTLAAVPEVPVVTVEPGSTTADVNWAADENADAWDLRYRPYVEGSDSGFSITLPLEGYEEEIADVSILDYDGDGYNWGINYSGTGTDDLAFISESYTNGSGLTPDNWLIMPLLELDGVIEFSMWHYSSYPEKMQVMIGLEDAIDGNTVNTGMFTTIASYTTESNTPVDYSIDISSYAGQKGYVVFRHTGTTDQWRLYLDNIFIGKHGPEPAPWTYVYGLEDPNYTIEGLTPETTYEVQVQGYNEDFDSDWSEIVQFTTLAEPQGLRGDVNNDGDVNIADVTALIDYLLSQDASSINLDNADCNLDTEVNIADVTALIDFLLSNAWPAK